MYGKTHLLLHPDQIPKYYNEQWMNNDPMKYSWSHFWMSSLRQWVFVTMGRKMFTKKTKKRIAHILVQLLRHNILHISVLEFGAAYIRAMKVSRKLIVGDVLRCIHNTTYHVNKMMHITMIHLKHFLVTCDFVSIFVFCMVWHSRAIGLTTCDTTAILPDYHYVIQQVIFNWIYVITFCNIIGIYRYRKLYSNSNMIKLSI